MPSPGGSYYGQFTTSNPSTGAGQNADSLPTAHATHNGVSDAAFVLTVTNTATGVYNVAGVIPVAYLVGDWVAITITATVAGITDSVTLTTFSLTGTVLAAATPTGSVATLYANDEDIAVRAAGDFAVLCPDWQKRAYGTDGVIAAGDLWTLTSASVNFLTGGVVAGCVCQLQKPVSAYKGSGELLAVDSATSSTITLRRLRAASGVGMPPAPLGGLTGIQFAITTLAPQIEAETYLLNQRYSIDPTLPGRDPPSIADLRVLNYACVLGVLQKRYAAEVRTASSDFSTKLEMIRNELGEVYARLAIRWAAATIGQDKTSFFSTRIVR